MGPQTSNRYGRGIGSAGSMTAPKRNPEDQITDAMRKAVTGLKKFGEEVGKVAVSVANDLNKAVGGQGVMTNGDGFSSASRDGYNYSSPQVGVGLGVWAGVGWAVCGGV